MPVGILFGKPITNGKRAMNEVSSSLKPVLYRP